MSRRASILRARRFGSLIHRSPPLHSSVNGTARTIPVVSGMFADTTLLEEGLNLITVTAPGGSDSVQVIRIVNHTPTARAVALSSGGSVTLSGSPSTDPDGQPLTDFLWLDDPDSPLGLAGQTGPDGCCCPSRLLPGNITSA